MINGDTGNGNGFKKLGTYMYFMTVFMSNISIYKYLRWNGC